MKRDIQKKPLYRKVNTKARNVHHNTGGDFRHSRHQKRESLAQTKGKMSARQERGLDYTPLFRFLLSKVGTTWNEVFSEAKARLDKTEPIFWMVALNPAEKEDCVRIGETSFFSGLFVDDDGILQRSNPDLAASDLKRYCNCCTHSFNGKVY